MGPGKNTSIATGVWVESGGIALMTGLIHPVPGLRLATAAAGIRYQGRDDLALLEASPGSSCAAVFTRNAFCAAPVVVAREHLRQAAPRYLLVNAGNANAGTGDAGIAAARDCCARVAELAHCAAAEVMPFSTGVIGEPLPVARVDAALPGLLDSLREDAWEAAARAIMTTDTVPKCLSRQVRLAGRTITLTGIAKGVGMIKPDMATMLAFLATDALVARDELQALLHEAVADSFNAITVDGDTSTNDACVLLATGRSGQRVEGSDRQRFGEALGELCEELARLLIRDGEGATRFVTIRVEQGRDREECRQAAYTIAESPLVKTALFAGDPNWGRILAALGRAGLADLQVERVSLFLDEICIVQQGARATAYHEEQGQTVMARPEITIRVVLGRGESSATIWSTDLSYDYVRINAEYRS